MASLFKKAKDRSSKDKTRSTSGNANNVLHDIMNAPTEVAQAQSFHTSRGPGELSFKKGDFFHVISTEVSQDGTIEIYDPISNTKGRAPAHCFKLFEKNHRLGNDSNRNSSSTNGNDHQNYEMSPSKQRHASSVSTSSTSCLNTKPHNTMGNLFGVVLYDFKSERSDELTVNAGDAIFICAHHEFEWYIAKFLNKVGEVGLVPVSYVQLIDAITRIPINDLPKNVIERENLPTVDQWKTVKNKHKASSRNVGNGSLNSHSTSIEQRSSSTGYSTNNVSILHPINANIESFSSTNNSFWYLLRVTMSDGSIRSLCRYYEDFFNFHQKLLSAFPREGGRFDTKEKHERIIPIMSGPVIEVTESLCHKRLFGLNQYLIELIQLPDYISKSSLVLSFFNLLDGDEISSSQSSNSYIQVEPNRPSPSLRILNNDRQSSSSSSSSSSFNTRQTAPQHPMYQNSHHHHHGPPERLSQSNQDRKSQYSMTNISTNYNRQSMRKNSVSSNLSEVLPIQHMSIQQNAQNLNQQTTSSGDHASKLKLKFYYKEDIFAISINSRITLVELKKMIVPKIDEKDIPNIESRIELYAKNDVNIDQTNYEKSAVISSDNELWNSTNFADKGKFLIIV